MDVHLIERRAGFWLRVGAFGFDFIVVYAVAWCGEKAANFMGLYLPFEAAVLTLLAIESIALTVLLGGSVGKLVCGLQVLRKDGSPVSWPAAFTRETIAKTLSFVAVGLGFIWIGWNQGKRGWHDLIAGTYVQRQPRFNAVNKLLLGVSFTTLAVAFSVPLIDWVSAVVLFRRMAPRDVAPLAFEKRVPENLSDVSTISDIDRDRLLDWLNQQGRPPLDYVVDKARKHQVVVIGEIHEQLQLLDFLNELVPRLYYEAGVTRIAMECCPTARNADLEQLVIADTFDRDLQLSIARQGAAGQPWGFKEYWDVLETVWKLNQSLPADRPRMLVVGLSPEFDQPSLMMLGDLQVPWWERLRIGRAVRALPWLVASDAFYARQIQEEIIEPGHRGLVWVGYAHSCLEVPNPGAKDGHDYPRMGFMLHQQYGDRLFQIRMHAPMIRVSDVDPSQPPAPARLPALLNELFDRHKDIPVGFDVAGSPFEFLRDNLLWDDARAPRLGLVDRAQGYIMLARSDRLNKCHWIPNFVTPQMFAQQKPYYQALALRERGTADIAKQFNAVFGNSN